MRNTFLLTIIVIALLISSCTEDTPSFEGKISGFIIYSETGVQKAVYYFAYDNEGRVIEKSSPLGEESIAYNNLEKDQEVSQWVLEFSSGSKTENLQYKAGKLDNISIDYEFPLSGLDMISYEYDANNCVSKTEMLDNEAVNIYHYYYNTNGLFDEVHVASKVQDDTLFYAYEYDNSGNVSEIYLNGNAHASFEYTSFDNPLYTISKPHLLNIPIDPDYAEKPALTSKFLLSKETYYSSIGVVDMEINYTYTLNDKGKPGIASRNVNGTDEEIIYTYY